MTLDLAIILVLASGYRIRALPGHHQLAFAAAGVALGVPAGSLIAYLDMCRRRRNVISYDSDEASEESASELVREATRFSTIVDTWLIENRPDLA